MRPPFLNRLLWVVTFASLGCCLTLLFVLQPVRVEGYSMLPGLAGHERLLVEKAGARALRRGDIVAFRYPREPDLDLIKRIIGLPGDRVAIRSGFVYVNEHRLSEPYVSSGFRGESELAERRVPVGEYFVLGDNRDQSIDSRAWGWLPGRCIFGRAVFAYWPPDRAGLIR